VNVILADRTGQRERERERERERQRETERDSQKIEVAKVDESVQSNATDAISVQQPTNNPCHIE